MARRSKDPLTLDLFEIPRPAAPLPGSMDFSAEVSAVVADALCQARAVGADRYEIAARMSRLVGRDISKHMLDAYASEAREAHNLPFCLVPVLEEATETHLFTNWLSAKRGGRVLYGKEALHAELGKLERLKEDVASQIRDLKKLMGALG